MIAQSETSVHGEGPAPEAVPIRALLGLPGIPGTGRGVRDHVRRAGWRTRTVTGRGGDRIEVFVADLPEGVRAALARRRHGVDADGADEIAWRRFADASPAAKDEARRRLPVVRDAQDRIAAGESKRQACAATSATHRVSASTVRNWLDLVDGVGPKNWLPALLPNWAGGRPPKDRTLEFIDLVKADYLRLAKPSLRTCYRRALRTATAKGWTDLPSYDTVSRDVKKLDPAVVTLARKGEKAFDRLHPCQRRTRSVFTAMQALTMDGRKHDLFARWPDGTIGRPNLVAAQDLFSGKILGWRVDKTENKDQVRLVLMDVFERYGVAEHVYFDNGHAFANKWLTGQTPTRFRFPIKDEDPVGLLGAVGCTVHFVKPASGQSKPVERAFRDMADAIDRHPAFQGAYCGNAPHAKPEDYGVRAVDIAEFLKVVASEIAEHNARLGRRTGACGGKLSFDQAFTESYQANPVGKLAPSQRHLFLLAAEGVTCQQPRGEIRLHENRYWSEALLPFIGRKVVVWFDPDNLHQPIFAETLDGQLISELPCIADTGFNDTAAAREHARAKAQFRKHKKAALKAERTMTAAEIAVIIPDAVEPVDPDTKIVRPVRLNPKRAPAKTNHAGDRKFEDDINRRIEQLRLRRQAS